MQYCCKRIKVVYFVVIQFAIPYNSGLNFSVSLGVVGFSFELALIYVKAYRM